MLYETVTGKKFSKVIDDAMTFIVNHLDLPSHVWVDITMQKLPEGSCGGCVDLGDDGDHHYFDLDINNNLTQQEIVRTIFHEMKHVEQTVNGRLDQRTWCGIDYTGVAYNDRPWEKEAYEFESRTISEYNRVNREDVH